MSNFDNFVNGSKVIFTKLGSETDKLIDKSKTSVKIYSYEQEKERFLLALGEYTFKNFNDENFKENQQFSDLIKKLNEFDEKIIELKKEKQMKGE